MANTANRTKATNAVKQRKATRDAQKADVAKAKQTVDKSINKTIVAATRALRNPEREVEVTKAVKERDAAKAVQKQKEMALKPNSPKPRPLSRKNKK